MSGFLDMLQIETLEFFAMVRELSDDEAAELYELKYPYSPSPDSTEAYEAHLNKESTMTTLILPAIDLNALFAALPAGKETEVVVEVLGAPVYFSFALMFDGSLLHSDVFDTQFRTDVLSAARHLFREYLEARFGAWPAESDDFAF